MNLADIRIEAPRKPGEETEFFLQRTGAGRATCSAHIHNAVELLYMQEGSFRAILDGTEYIMEKGDLILICSNTIHHVSALDLPDNSYYVIKIPPTFFLNLASGNSGTEYMMRFALNRKDCKTLWKRDELENSTILPVLQSIVQENRHRSYAYEVAMRLKTMELLLAILREDPHRPEATHDRATYPSYQVMEHVRKHYAQDISEQELAGSLGMSYHHFSRSFKRVTGITFREYLNQTRIHQAERMLHEGGRSVSEVAIECGYNSISYFIRVFRTLTGRTPYQILKSRKAEKAE